MRAWIAGPLLYAALTLPLAAAPAARPSSATEVQAALGRYLSTQANREPGLRYPHERCFRRAAKTFELPLTLLLAVARGESDFDPRARSHANAHGLMQIQWPETAAHLGIHRLERLYEPCTNVEAGARYLRELLDRYGGNIYLALAAYNYGPNRIPVGATPNEIPHGARWYTRYIYDHLQSVLRHARPPQPTRLAEAPEPAQVAEAPEPASVAEPLQASVAGEAQPSYASQGKAQVAVFRRPYRAEGFVRYLRAQEPSLELDWFRMGVGLFRVVVVYQDREELVQARRRLRQHGVIVPEHPS